MNQALLIEFGLEELPALSIGTLSEAFRVGLLEALAQQGFEGLSAHAYGSMRHLGVSIESISDCQADQYILRRGPAKQVALKDGVPTQALLGFANRFGVGVEALTCLSEEKGAPFAFTEHVPGKPLAQVLQTILPEVLENLPIPKAMRWGDTSFVFVRPVHTFVAMHGKEVLPITMFGIPASNHTLGHRIHHPEHIRLSDASSYVEALKEVGIMVEEAKRHAHILELAQIHAKKHQANLELPPKLLAELSGLSECPFIVEVPFDARFLSLPKAVLITVMQKHQRTIALTNTHGALLPTVLFLTNQRFDDPKWVAQGQSRVLSARFEDARFFYQHDLSTPLSHHLQGLSELVLHEKLGSYYDKVQRMMKLAQALNAHFAISKDHLEEAVSLCKCDLRTMMVQEFTELQGSMGALYASHHGSAQEVCSAIFEHYLPRHAEDSLPTTPLGILLALTDKIDHLVGFFSIGLVPSGSKDPFALRRAALTILKIVLQHRLSLPLLDILKTHLETCYPNHLSDTLEKLSVFLQERLKGLWDTFEPCVIEALLSQAPSNPYLAFQKAELLDRGGLHASLPQSHKRLKNILAKASWPKEADRLWSHPSEHALDDCLNKIELRYEDIVHAGNLEEALTLLITLSSPLEHFFNEVMVMDEDLSVRNRRLALLARAESLLSSFGDFSCLQ